MNHSPTEQNAKFCPLYSFPLARSIQLATAYLNQIGDRTRDNVLVVITDGNDTCGNRPIRQTRFAFQAGYKVYVIGFGGAVDGQTLQRMAYYHVSQ